MYYEDWNIDNPPLVEQLANKTFRTVSKTIEEPDEDWREEIPDTAIAEALLASKKKYTSFEELADLAEARNPYTTFMGFMSGKTVRSVIIGNQTQIIPVFPLKIRSIDEEFNTPLFSLPLSLDRLSPYSPSDLKVLPLGHNPSPSVSGES